MNYNDVWVLVVVLFAAYYLDSDVLFRLLM